jgi:TonB family protein
MKLLRAKDRLSYIQRGLAAEERALTAEPDFVDAIVDKSLLLRAQAETESNAAHRAALVKQADDLRLRVGKARQTTSTASLEFDNLNAYPAPPPPPPVTGAGEIVWVYAETSYVTANGGSTPKKVKDVRPVYPPMAIRLGLEGRVVLQAAIDARGYVVSARVIESIPLLTSPTIDAVRQWRFDPATINTAAGPW